MWIIFQGMVKDKSTNDFAAKKPRDIPLNDSKDSIQHSLKSEHVFQQAYLSKFSPYNCEVVIVKLNNYMQPVKTSWNGPLRQDSKGFVSFIFLTHAHSCFELGSSNINRTLFRTL